MSGLDQLSSLVHFKVKNGLKILFWHDLCCGDQPRKIQFRSLFRMTRLKEATLHQVVTWNGGQNH